MMGNFLTTLGAEPADDREMFDRPRPQRRPPARQRLEPAPRQPQRLARGRQPAATPIDDLIDTQAEADLWDPSTQLRVIARSASPRPTRTPTGTPPHEPDRRPAEGPDGRRSGSRRSATTAFSGGCGPSLRPQGPRVCSTAATSCCSARTTTSASPPHPDVSAAAVAATERWGAGAGASRLVSGNMTPHGRLEQRLAGFHGTETALLFGSGYLANTGVIAALARRGDVVFSDELNHAQHHRRLPARRRRDVRLPPPRPRAPRLGSRPAPPAAAA